MTDVITVKGLKKRFDEVQAVNDISFSVKSGELFGFLGPNGAGKTTTINMITGLAKPDNGSINIAGIDCTGKPKSAQHLIGVVPDESNLYPELTGYENLCFCASLYGLSKHERQKKAKDLLAVFGLDKAADRKFAGYSKGMKRKLTIAAGMIHNPQILFLDEPTTGIDVASARQLRNLVSKLHAQGTTIFLTTHYIEEAERLCDRIAFIVDGKLVKIDKVSKLLLPLQNVHRMQVVCADLPGDIVSGLSKSFPEMVFKSKNDNVVEIENGRPISVAPIVRYLEEQGAHIFEAKLIRPSLEDVFVEITGIEADAMRKEKEKRGKKK